MDQALGAGLAVRDEGKTKTECCAKVRTGIVGGRGKKSAGPSRGPFVRARNANAACPERCIREGRNRLCDSAGPVIASIGRHIEIGGIRVGSTFPSHPSSSSVRFRYPNLTVGDGRRRLPASLARRLSARRNFAAEPSATLEV